MRIQKYRRDWLTPHQVAVLMDLDMKTVLKFLSTGEIKGRRMGRKWFIPRAIFDGLIKETEESEAVK